MTSHAEDARPVAEGNARAALAVVAVELLQYVCALEAEVAAWRSLVYAGLDVSAQLHVDLERARATISRLREAARPHQGVAA